MKRTWILVALGVGAGLYLWYRGRAKGPAGTEAAPPLKPQLVGHFGMKLEDSLLGAECPCAAQPNQMPPKFLA